MTELTRPSARQWLLFPAALALSLDGTVGTLVSGLTNSYAHLRYDVAGYKVADPNGTDYWVFAAQVTVS